MGISGNIGLNQGSYLSPLGGGPAPMSQGKASFSTPWGVGQGYVRGVGTTQIGPGGVSTSVPYAAGFEPTPMWVDNGLGLASPFATNSKYLNNINPNSFGFENPYSPLIGTPWDMPDSLNALGTFGGVQNAFSPYSGLSLPLDDGSMAFGGPGGATGGNQFDSPIFGGNGQMGPSVGGFGGGGGGLPGLGGGVPGFGGGGGGLPGLGGGLPGLGGGAPVGGGLPGLGGGAPVGGGAPDLFNNPNLFGNVPPGTVPGIAQTFSHQGGGLESRYSVISDGVARLFMQGNNSEMPRQHWGSGTTLRSPWGIHETGVGPMGGHANAGILGTQAAGQAWAMNRNPVNPAMIISYSNPYYNNYNWNQGFTNA